jgi:hypothetical protein
MSLNLVELNASTQKIYESRIRTYEQIKKDCYNRITIASKIPGKLDCWYIVPQLIVGYPPINISDGTNYLKTELDKENILYEFFIPNIFYITWDINKINNKKNI